jgi:ribosome-associated translation inhibitor RaiA
MQIQYRGKTAASDAARRVVERETGLLDQRLRHVANDLKTLAVTMEHHLRDDSLTATLLLRVPGQQLVSTGHGPRDDTALRDAFADLRDQLDRYLAKLRGEPSKRREGKFHRDKAELTSESVDAVQGWPPEPPASEDEAADWGQVRTSRND